MVGVPWRADIRAVAIVAPWWDLLGAVRRKHCDAEELEAVLWGGRTARAGPIAAAWAGLRRAQVSWDTPGRGGRQLVI